MQRAQLLGILMRVLFFIAALLLSAPAHAQNTLFPANPGDMIVKGALAWTPVPGGTAGCALLSNGPTAAPTWQCALPLNFQLPPMAVNTVWCNVSGAQAPATACNISQILNTIDYDIQRPPLAGSVPYVGTDNKWHLAPPPAPAGWVWTAEGTGHNPQWAPPGGYVAPGAAGTCLVSNGPLVPPSFATCPTAASSPVIFCANDPYNVTTGLGAGVPQTAGLQACLNASIAAAGKPAILPCGIFYIDATITTAAIGTTRLNVFGCNYYGNGVIPAVPGTLVKSTPAFVNGDMFYAKGDYSPQFVGFAIGADAPRTTGAGIHISPSLPVTQNVTNLTIEGMTIYYQQDLIWLEQNGGAELAKNWLALYSRYAIRQTHLPYTGGDGLHHEMSLGFAHHNTIIGDCGNVAGGCGTAAATSQAGIFIEGGYGWIHDNGMQGSAWCVWFAPTHFPAGSLHIHDNVCENSTSGGYVAQTGDGSSTQDLFITNNTCFVLSGTYVDANYACVFLSPTNSGANWITRGAVDNNVSRAALKGATGHFKMYAGADVSFTNNKAQTDGVGGVEVCFAFDNFLAADTVALNNKCSGASYPARVWYTGVVPKIVDYVGVPFANRPAAAVGSQMPFISGVTAGSRPAAAGAAQCMAFVENAVWDCM